MKTSKYYFFLITALVWLSGCKPDTDTATPTKGSADFSRYIAIGNSLTAGYADGGLYREGQLNSYPSIIAKQMESVGGGAFNQPLFEESQANGSGYLQLTGFNPDNTPIITPVTSNLGVREVLPVPGFGNVTLYTKYTGDINNYGVPGIKLLHITYPAYGNLNGFYERLLPGNSPINTTTYLDFVTAKPFSFFTDWLGNNDALLYATSGGAGDELTDKATFAALYNGSINKLTASGAKGAVATIPDVTAIPYFNTVTGSAILAAVQKQNPAAQALYISARTSADASSATYAPRAATAEDKITLTFPTAKIGQPVQTPAGALPYGLTPYSPIENKYVLDKNEVALTQDYVNFYNTTIKNVAAAKGLAVFDAYTFLNGLNQKGMVYNGISVNSRFITGGVFSLDGVHLTPRGYAIVANEFINAINKQYGSSIPLADITQFRGTKFP